MTEAMSEMNQNTVSHSTTLLDLLLSGSDEETFFEELANRYSVRKTPSSSH